MATTRTNRLRTLAALAALTISFVAFPGHATETDGEDVWRSLPQGAVCGETLTITLTVDPPEGTESWLVVEHLPDGATVEHVDPSQNGAYNENHHRIEWVSLNAEAATLTYDVVFDVDLEGPTEFGFAGDYRFHPQMDNRSSITGQQGLVVECFASPEPGVPATMERVLPDGVRCGSTFEVIIAVVPAENTAFWLVEEKPPGEVEVEDVTSRFEGDYNERTGLIKWLSLSAEPTLLRYNVTVPDDLPRGTELVFSGEHGFMPSQGDIQTTQGDERIDVACSNLTPLLLGGSLVVAAAGVGLFVFRKKNGSGLDGPAGDP